MSSLLGDGAFNLGKDDGGDDANAEDNPIEMNKFARIKH